MREARCNCAFAANPVNRGNPCKHAWAVKSCHQGFLIIAGSILCPLGTHRSCALFAGQPVFSSHSLRSLLVQYWCSLVDALVQSVHDIFDSIISGQIPLSKKIIAGSIVKIIKFQHQEQKIYHHHFLCGGPAVRGQIWKFWVGGGGGPMYAIVNPA